MTESKKPRCEWCNEPFKKTANNQKFCCRRCCWLDGYTRRKPKYDKKPCLHCKRSFEPVRGYQIYCSKSCRDKRFLRKHGKLKPRVTVTCARIGCNVEFVRRTKQHKYCSKACVRESYKPIHRLRARVYRRERKAS